MNTYPREASILRKRPLERTSDEGYPRPPQYFPTNVEPKTQYIEANERPEMQYFQVNEKTNVHNFQANVKHGSAVVGKHVTSEDGTKSDDTTPVESTSQLEQLDDESPAEKKTKIDESASIQEEEEVVKEGLGSGGRSEDVVSREHRRVSDYCDGEISGHLLLLSFPTSLPPFPSLSPSHSLPLSASLPLTFPLPLSLPFSPSPSHKIVSTRLNLWTWDEAH